MAANSGVDEPRRSPMNFGNANSYEIGMRMAVSGLSLMRGWLTAGAGGRVLRTLAGEGLSMGMVDSHGVGKRGRSLLG